jgi:4-carboxymuconolactone decarboxylase
MDPSFPEILSLARISAAIGVRNERKLRLELKSALRSKIEAPVIREVILQSYLFAGYASAINAFVLLNELVPADHRFLTERGTSIDVWKTRGRRLCKTIYGKQYDKLVRNMSRLHPDLSEWMIFEGYGKVLSRPFLSPRVRELLIVAITAVLQTERQFHSHVKGALHTGSSARDLRQVLKGVSSFQNAAACDRFRALLEGILLTTEK